MVELVTYAQENLPAALKHQVITMLDRVWPRALPDARSAEHPLHDPNTHPTCMMLMKDGTLVAYTGVPWKMIEHANETYTAYGLSCVMSHPDFRGQGYGRQMVDAATAFIKSNNPDLGIFTCDPPLQPFYEGSGWTIIENSPLIGGTRQKPFPSDTLNKVTMGGFFSPKAIQNQAAFTGVPIHLDLREGDLW